ncbi:MAG: ROK family transcriptional regulator [Armatimonadota bacterium]
MRIEPSIRENDAHMPAIWRILATLLCDSTVCQADLRARTGLSHPVVVQQVAQLRRSGLILFGHPQGGVTGRPRIPITFNWEFRRLLAVEVHPHGITFQATNLSGQPMGEPETRPQPKWTQDGVNAALFSVIREALQMPGSPWAGIGVVLPAAIAADRRTLVSWLDISDWQDDPLGNRLTDEFNLPIFLYNEAEALARSVWAEEAEPPRSIMAVSVRQDLRAVMAVMSSACTGYVTDGPFGAIGHLPISESGLKCAYCGVPCLNAAFSAAREQASCRPQAVQALAKIAADMVTIFNPGRLVLQGDAAWTPEDTETVRAELRARAFPGAGQGLLLEDHPYRATESLVGVASALAGQLLNLSNGRLNEWATLSA